MQISNSFDLLAFLKSQNLLRESPQLWWKNAGNFEVIIGAILTQNTNWKNVESSLNALQNANLLNLKSLANCDIFALQNAIRASGFFRQKAARLQGLAQNIMRDFGDFENFQSEVSREWLLNQKGVGFESADSILNYACFRDVCVADKYTQRLLAGFGFEFYDYEEIRGFLERGIRENYDALCALYGREIALYEAFARFHGKIVEYGKLHPVKKLSFSRETQ